MCPGTLMTFGGVPSEKQRADVIAYLNSNSDSPQPLPKAADAGAGRAAPRNRRFITGSSSRGAYRTRM